MSEWPSGCICRICSLRRAAISGLRFGLPLVCPKCELNGGYYGVLKVPGQKAAPTCPNCSTGLLARRGA